MNNSMKLLLCINDYEQQDLYIELKGLCLPLVVQPSFQYPKVSPFKSFHLTQFWAINALPNNDLIKLLDYIKSINTLFNYINFTKWLSDYLVCMSSNYPCAETATYLLGKKDIDWFYCELSKSNIVGF